MIKYIMWLISSYFIQHLICLSELVFLNFFLSVISFLAVATDIMVAIGTDGSDLDSVETIRIRESSNAVTVEKCSQTVPAYPMKVKYAGATLVNGEPLICGGNNGNKCYQLQNMEWQVAPQLPSGRNALKMTSTDATTFISGGDGAKDNNVLQLNGGEWQPVTPFPIYVREHCLVAINSTNLLNIGGWSSSGVSK